MELLVGVMTLSPLGPELISFSYFSLVSIPDIFSYVFSISSILAFRPHRHHSGCLFGLLLPFFYPSSSGFSLPPLVSSGHLHFLRWDRSTSFFDKELGPNPLQYWRLHRCSFMDLESLKLENHLRLYGTRASESKHCILPHIPRFG